MRKIVSGLLLALFSISVSVLLIEFLLGYLHKREMVLLEDTRGGNIFCTRPSPSEKLIYERIPGKCGANQQGYRDYEYALEKGEGIYRIVVIGDSIADGHGLPLEKSFTKILERDLNNDLERKDLTFEVISLALGGYSTVQELAVLEHQAFDYAPDLIVWSYVLNDPAHPVYRGASGQVGKYHYKPTYHILHFVEDKLFKIKEKFKARHCDREYHALLHCAYRDEIEENIDTIARLASENAVPVVFLIHPIIEENGDYASYPLFSEHEDLSSIAAAAGLAPLDLLTPFSEYTPAQLSLPNESWYDIWHPNELGHQIVAASLAHYIEQHIVPSAQALQN